MMTDSEHYLPASPSGTDGRRPLGEEASKAWDSLKGGAEDLSGKAQSLASDAGESALAAADRQRAAGADLLGGVGSAIHKAAEEIEKSLPIAAPYVRSAADTVDGFSQSIRERSVGEIVGDVQDFARRQPALFLGASVLAGFGLIRLLKNAADAADDRHTRG
jgi:hypothetical protein